MKKTREEIKAAIVENLEKLSQAELNSLFQKVCPHESLDSKQKSPDEDGSWGYAYCSNCGNTAGEWCPSSPTKLCQYQDDDLCKYCGQMDPWEDK
jgi:hypothetical protein